MRLPLALCALSLVIAAPKPAAASNPEKWAHSPIRIDGLELRIKDIDADDEDLELEMEVKNTGQGTLSLKLQEMVLVSPWGPKLKAKNNKKVIIKAGKKKSFDLDFEADDYDFEDLDGVYVSFEGVYRDNQPVALPIMTLGKPTFPAPAGAARAAEAPPSTSTSTSTAAPPPTEGLQAFTGERVRIKAVGTKAAALPLRASEVPKQMSFIIDELLLTELQAAGFEAIGPDDINAMVGFEGLKDQMGCNDASCVAEVGNALGVPFLVAGSVAKLEDSVVITLKLINVKETSVQARVSKIADGSTKVLPRAIGEVVQELVRKAKL